MQARAADNFRMSRRAKLRGMDTNLKRFIPMVPLLAFGQLAGIFFIFLFVL